MIASVPPLVEVRGALATNLETSQGDNVISPGFEAPRLAARHTSTNDGAARHTSISAVVREPEGRN